MTNLTQPNMQNAAGMPPPDDLDRLVDDELPEPRRRELLRRMDSIVGGWRAVALRFLHQQVERRVALDIINPRRLAQRNRQVVSSLSRRLWPLAPQALRLAAAVVLTATLFAIGGLYFGRISQRSSEQTTPAQAPTVVVTADQPLSGGGGGGTDTLQAPAVATAAGQGRIQILPDTIAKQLASRSMPVLDPSAVPAGYPFLHQGQVSSPQHIVVVSEGSDRVVAYPVVPVAAEKTPLY